MGISSFIAKCRRVLMVASKPDPEEYKHSIKIIGLGIVIIGAIGFIIFIIAQLLGGL